METVEEVAIRMFIKHPDLYSKFNRVNFTGKQLKEVAIEVAKLHVKAALEAVTDITHKNGIPRIVDNKESILSAYSESNIK